ncbi:MAG: MBL fold metallo-hydrolase [Nitrospirae bacterium]|nr:MBL fold metallo-hydrolase [Nitrospirota bacterium]
MNLEDEFGDIILKARAGLGLSVDQVSKATGMTKLEVTQLEAYAKNPSPQECNLFAELLHLTPSRLLKIVTREYFPSPVPSAAVKNVLTLVGHIGTYEVKGYLVVDLGSRDAVMIDTANNPEGMLEALSHHGWNLKHIFLTHTHQDHIGGLEKILRNIKVPVYVSQEEVGQLGHVWDSGKDRVVKEGDQIVVGEIAFNVLEVPGHTAGGRGYFTSPSEFPFSAPPYGFFGDSIFAGSLGRAYSPVSYPQLLFSVKEKVLNLPGETVIFPGHGPATTVVEEREHNPFFK